MDTSAVPARVPQKEDLPSRSSISIFWDDFIRIGRERLTELSYLHEMPMRTPSPETVEHRFDENKCLGALDDTMERHISETVDTLKNQLDNTLLFSILLGQEENARPQDAALFSAVNSALLAPNPIDSTNALLSSVFEALANTSSPIAVSNSSSSPSSTMLVNQLFSASLMCSLIATLGAVMGQSWLTSYSHRPGVMTAELRENLQRKVLGAERWHLRQWLEVVLPTVLQILFPAGFLILLGSISDALFNVVLPLAVIGFGCFVASVVVALWDPYCPFQTALATTVFPSLFSGVYRLYYAVFALSDCTLFAARLLRNRAHRHFHPEGRRWVRDNAQMSMHLDDAKRRLTLFNETDRDKYLTQRAVVASKLRRPQSSAVTIQGASVLWMMAYGSHSERILQASSTLLLVRDSEDIQEIARNTTLTHQIASRAVQRLPFVDDPLRGTYAAVVSHLYFHSGRKPNPVLEEAMVEVLSVEGKVPLDLEGTEGELVFSARLKLILELSHTTLNRRGVPHEGLQLSRFIHDTTLQYTNIRSEKSLSLVLNGMGAILEWILRTKAPGGDADEVFEDAYKAVLSARGHTIPQEVPHSRPQLWNDHPASLLPWLTLIMQTQPLPQWRQNPYTSYSLHLKVLISKFGAFVTVTQWADLCTAIHELRLLIRGLKSLKDEWAPCVSEAMSAIKCLLRRSEPLEFGENVRAAGHVCRDLTMILVENPRHKDLHLIRDCMEPFMMRCQEGLAAADSEWILPFDVANFLFAVGVLTHNTLTHPDSSSPEIILSLTGAVLSAVAGPPEPDDFDLGSSTRGDWEDIATAITEFVRATPKESITEKTTLVIRDYYTVFSNQKPGHLVVRELEQAMAKLGEVT